MLDPWIIEQIKKREEKLRREGEAKRIQIPVATPEDDLPVSNTPPPQAPPEQSDRGVVVIDM